MRRHVTGDRQAGGLRPSDEVERAGRREVRHVEASARHVPDHVGEDREIARDDRLLGRGRPSAEPQDGRDEPLVRLRAGRERRLLRVLHDRAAEHPGIPEGVREQHRPPDGRAVVAESHDPGVDHLPERREALAGAPGRHRPDDLERDGRPRRRGRRADESHRRGAVDRRRRVGHRADAGEAAVRGGREAGRDRLGVLEARLPEMRVEVREPGRDDDARGVHALRRGAGEPPDARDLAVADDDLARPLETRERIHQPRPRDLEVREPRPDPQQARRPDGVGATRGHPRPAALHRRLRVTRHRRLLPRRPRRRGGTAAPCGRPRRWSPGPR
jgi:hypothetical protein